MNDDKPSRDETSAEEEVDDSSSLSAVDCCFGLQESCELSVDARMRSDDAAADAAVAGDSSTTFVALAYRS